MTDLLIIVFGVCALAFAVLMLTVRQPMRAALALVAHMVSLAAIYACLDVHVVALFQVLIYVGAVMVFMIYTIMLLDDRDAAYRQMYSRATTAAAIVATALAATLLALVGHGAPDAAMAAPGATSPFAFTAFSVAFMKHYWFHFEIATVLLLVGMVAAWTVIRESR
jgi:NADH-quinone oxidoreductase subunit J